MQLRDLPIEKIYEICEQMEPEDLNKFIRTSKENYEICHDILDKKLKKEIETAIARFQKRGFIMYKKIFNEDNPCSKSFIEFEWTGKNKVIVMKDDYVRFSPNSWIFPDLEMDKNKNKMGIVESVSQPFNYEDLGSKIKTVLENGYKSVEYYVA